MNKGFTYMSKSNSLKETTQQPPGEYWVVQLYHFMIIILLNYKCKYIVGFNT